MVMTGKSESPGGFESAIDTQKSVVGSIARTKRASRMKTSILFLTSLILCGCSKAPVEKAAPPASPTPAPVAEYTNSFINELAIQIKAAQRGFEYGRMQAMQMQQLAHFSGDVGPSSKLGSYSFEELTNKIISDFWRQQTNSAVIQK